MEEVENKAWILSNPLFTADKFMLLCTFDKNIPDEKTCLIDNQRRLLESIFLVLLLMYFGLCCL